MKKKNRFAKKILLFVIIYCLVSAPKTKRKHEQHNKQRGAGGGRGKMNRMIVVMYHRLHRKINGCVGVGHRIKKSLIKSRMVWWRVVDVPAAAVAAAAGSPVARPSSCSAVYRSASPSTMWQRAPLSASAWSSRRCSRIGG